jgi:CubicO group peptidase (beta-lactamase class C family)
MNAKRIILISVMVVVGILLAGIGRIAWLATSGFRPPVRVRAPDYWPTDGWKTSTPEEQGFDSAKLAQGLQSLREKQVGIDSLMLIHNGYVVMDAHFAPYDGTFPHDLASATKSVMTTLIGIAADQEKLDLDQKMVSFFTDRTIANLDERKQAITIRHLVSNRNGMESGCYEGDAPTIQKMRDQADYVQAALDRPMTAQPGTEFCYDSPGMHLLSAILQEVTGMTALDFARQNLFEPLGIHEAIWESDPQGYSRGWGDLHLLPEDLAKLGLLWLQRGQWDGRQIVSEAWVLDSVQRHSKIEKPDPGYGYGWWICDKDYQASGRGGQRLRVMAALNLLVVVTGSGFEYSEVESWLIPMLLQVQWIDRLPGNPAGQALLQTELARAAQQPLDWNTTALPPIARSISGRPYTCTANPAGIQTVRLDFDGSPQAALAMQMAGTDYLFPVGLDGRYRLSPEGAASRGHWDDAQTFHFELFTIGVVSRQMVYSGDNLQISLPEADLTVACLAD